MLTFDGAIINKIDRTFVKREQSFLTNPCWIGIMKMSY